MSGRQREAIVPTGKGEATKEVTEYRSIDGNWVLEPVGWCGYHRGYVTAKQVKIHGCHRKHGGTCSRLQDMEGGNIKRMNAQQYQDKMIDRMQKLEASINRAVRSLDRIADAIEAEVKLAETIRVETMGDEAVFGGVEAMPVRPDETVEQDAEEWENIHR